MSKSPIEPSLRKGPENRPNTAIDRRVPVRYRRRKERAHFPIYSCNEHRPASVIQVPIRPCLQ